MTSTFVVAFAGGLVGGFLSLATLVIGALLLA